MIIYVGEQNLWICSACGWFIFISLCQEVMSADAGILMSLTVFQWKNLRVNKVGRPVDGVDDPGGVISQDTRFTCSHWLLPYEPDKIYNDYRRYWSGW